MSLPGERLLVATTTDLVEQGEIFQTLPPHMTLVRWANVQENRRFRIYAGLKNIFDDDKIYQDAVGGARGKFGGYDGTAITKIDLHRRDAAHSLIDSLGYFDPEDSFAHARSNETAAVRYQAHVSDTPERKIGEGEVFSFQSIGIFAVHADDPEIFTVLASYRLGQKSTRKITHVSDKKTRLV